MRDRVAHGYFAIDYEIVWNVAAVEIFALKAEIERILEVES